MLNKRNMAGLVRVLILPKDDIDGMPYLNLGRDTTEGAVTTTASWTELEFEKHTATLKEVSNKDGGNTVYALDITGKLVESTRLLHDDTEKRYIADVTDANGVRLLVGTDKEPLELKLKHDTGQPNTGNLTVLTLEGLLSERPPIYEP